MNPSDEQPIDGGVEWALRERLKELNVLVEVGRHTHHAPSIDSLLAGVVDLAPSGWQYPQAAVVRADVAGVSAQTAGFRETPWQQSEMVTLGGEVVGQIVVGYLEAFPDADEGPFLREERRLLQSIAAEIEGAVGRLAVERDLRHLLTHDQRTGLLNRDGLVAEVFRRAGDEPARPFGYFLVNLQRFGEVNRTFGFGVGDLITAEVGRRLDGRFGHISAREGGRFVFVVDDLAPEAMLPFLQQEVIPLLNAPYAVADINIPLFINFAVTGAHFPTHSDDPWHVAALADAALMRAASGSQQAVIVDLMLDGPESASIETLSRIRLGAERDEFILHYQPQVDRDRNVSGVEALIRWQRDDRLVSPGEFLELAERGGLVRDIITPLTARQAFGQAAAWSAAGRPLRVALNLSPSYLMSGRSGDRLLETIEVARLDPRLAEVEVTEGGIMADPARALEAINVLRAAGVRVALDDFGTGYSSLSLVRELPVDAVKIDRSFVRDVLTRPTDAVIVRSIVDMAHAVGAEVIAEGVEDEQTAEWLVEQQVETLQGYWFSRPLPPTEIPGWRAPSQ